MVTLEEVASEDFRFSPVASAWGVPRALASRDWRPLSLWPPFTLLMAWNDENAAFDCGVDDEVESSPCTAADASVASGLIAGPSPEADPAILIKCKVKLHQLPDGAQECVDVYGRYAFCWCGGSASSRETGDAGQPGSLVREKASRKSRQIAERGSKVKANTYHAYEETKMWGCE